MITLLSLVLFMGCSTSQKAMRDSIKVHQNEESKAKAAITASFIDSVNLSDYRTHLSDVYSTEDNTVPDAFKPLQSEKEHVVNDEGYRVQIISTSHKSKAENILHDFNDWIFEQPDITYKAMAYIIFKQPYYRVQIGDFENKERAINYSRKLKRKYPGAWVVQNKINPGMTPSEMEARFKKNQGNGKQ